MIKDIKESIREGNWMQLISIILLIIIIVLLSTGRGSGQDIVYPMDSQDYILIQDMEIPGRDSLDYHLLYDQLIQTIHRNIKAAEIRSSNWERASGEACPWNSIFTIIKREIPSINTKK